MSRGTAFRAAVREGDYEPTWRTLLPAAVELYNIAQDPSEKNNLAGREFVTLNAQVAGDAYEERDFH